MSLAPFWHTVCALWITHPQHSEQVRPSPSDLWAAGAARPCRAAVAFSVLSERPPHPHGVSLCVPCPCRSQLVLQRPGSLLCSTGSRLREGGLEWRAMAHLCVEALGSEKGLVLFSQRGRGWRRRLQGEARRGEAREAGASRAGRRVLVRTRAPERCPGVLSCTRAVHP